MRLFVVVWEWFGKGAVVEKQVSPLRASRSGRNDTFLRFGARVEMTYL
jgi:hypothetical protein